VSDLGIDINTPVVNGEVTLDPLFGLVSGRTALAQALARRNTTEHGLLAWIGDDPEYGHDVRQYLGEDVGPRAEFVVASRVQAECLKDERVRAAQVTASLVAGRLTIAATITDADGVFRLTLSVTAVSVEVLRVF
jgi:hypothetical protein